MIFDKISKKMAKYPLYSQETEKDALVSVKLFDSC